MNIREGVTKAQEDFEFYKSLHDAYKRRFEELNMLMRYINEEFEDAMVDAPDELDPMFTKLVAEIKRRRDDAKRAFEANKRGMDSAGETLIYQMKIM